MHYSVVEKRRTETDGEEKKKNLLGFFTPLERWKQTLLLPASVG